MVLLVVSYFIIRARNVKENRRKCASQPLKKIAQKSKCKSAKHISGGSALRSPNKLAKHPLKRNAKMSTKAKRAKKPGPREDVIQLRKREEFSSRIDLCAYGQ